MQQLLLQMCCLELLRLYGGLSLSQLELSLSQRRLSLEQRLLALEEASAAASPSAGC